MVGERQTHRVPNVADERERVARSLGFTGGTALADFDRVLEEPRRWFRRCSVRSRPRVVSSVSSSSSRATCRRCWAGASRAMLESLSAHFTREIARVRRSERAANNLDRFIAGVWPAPVLLRAAARSARAGAAPDRAVRHPRIIVAAACAASDVDRAGFLRSAVLLLDRAQLDADLAGIHAECAAREDGADEAQLAALRRFCHPS